jgi:hypothetical protein
VFNWPIDEGSSFKFENPHKLTSWSVFNWPIDEGNSFKLEHLGKSSYENAFNWPIDEAVLSSWNNLMDETFGVLSIG